MRTLKRPESPRQLKRLLAAAHLEIASQAATIAEQRRIIAGMRRVTGQLETRATPLPRREAA